MTAKLTTEEFIKRSKEKFNNTFTYEKTICINSTTPLIITCNNIDFEITPQRHLESSTGKIIITKNKLSRSCSICGEMMITESKTDLSGFIQHGKEKHPGYFLGALPEYKWIEKKYYNPINQTWYGSRLYLSRSLTKLGISNEEYYLKYGEQYMPEEWNKNNNHSILGNAHNHNKCIECGEKLKFDDGHWEYPAFCSNTKCNINWYNRNTKRHKIAGDSIKKTLLENNDVLPTQIGYWLKQGMNQEEAEIKLKERQQTFTLEKCIEKYGEDKGIERFNKRQMLWKESLKKSGMYCGYSMVSEKLFEEVEKTIPNIFYGKNEKAIWINEKKVIWVDCLEQSKKKIIEFYGDYWHGNPNKYKPTDLIKYMKGIITAEDKWKIDVERIKLLESKGYKVLIIWESEYVENPNLVIGKCIGFLM